MTAELTAAELIAEEKIISRAGLPVVLGGSMRSVLPLVIAANRAWKSKVVDSIAERWGALGGVSDWTQVVKLLSGSEDAVLDLLLAYDVDATLGGREWIESHATPREVFEAFKVVVREAFPLEEGALASFPAIVGMLLQAAGERMKVAEPPAPESSTKPSSTSGGASRAKSTRR